MNTLNFNDADLKANREGRLSDAQQKRLDADIHRLRQDRKSTRWLMGMIVAAIAIVGLIIVFHDIGQGVETPRLFSHLTAYARVNMIFIGLMGLAYLHGWWSLRGLTHATVYAIEGIAEVSSIVIMLRNLLNRDFFEPAKRLPMNRLRLRRSWHSYSTFHFQDKESLRYFENGRRYRVYYLRYAMPRALSAQEIEPEKSKR